MPVTNEKGSPVSKTKRLELLLNYCRTVVRSDDDLLQDAMGQYRTYLATQQRS